jgi:hypothetical protein
VSALPGCGGAADALLAIVGLTFLFETVSEGSADNQVWEAARNKALRAEHKGVAELVSLPTQGCGI